MAFLGIVHALAWMQKLARRASIYTDSKIAIGWVAKAMPHQSSTHRKKRRSV
ncbi:MAG: hypothetical protein R3B47_04230 [Bacteroidia bacterium]